MVTAAPIAVPVAAIPAPTAPRNTPVVSTPIPAPVVQRAPVTAVAAPRVVIPAPTAIPAPATLAAPQVAAPRVNSPVGAVSAATPVVVETPKLNTLDQWVQDNQVTFKGVASSGTKTIVILGTKLGDYEAEVGQVIPETKIRIQSADNAHLKLISGTLSKKMTITTGETTQ